MAEASHHDPSEAIHYPAQEDHVVRHGASFGLTALSILFAAAAIVLGFLLHQQMNATAALRSQLERANAETATGKTDLATANTNLKTLQSQLTAAQTQGTDLQAQLKKSQDSGTELQGQLDKAKADLKSQQESAQSQLNDLQAGVTKANESATGLRNDLTKARSENDDLKAQLAKAKDEAKAQAAPAVAAAAMTRPLPLTTSLKKSFFGSTYTLEMKNTGTDPLKVDLEISDSPNTPSKSVTIEGGGTVKVSDLAAGARIGIASDGFEPTSVTAK